MTDQLSKSIRFYHGIYIRVYNNRKRTGRGQYHTRKPVVFAARTALFFVFDFLGVSRFIHFALPRIRNFRFTGPSQKPPALTSGKYVSHQVPSRNAWIVIF